MRYRMLDVDGDYSFGKGQQNITYGIYAVQQVIKTRLLFLKGEWWENTEDGLPLFQNILGTSGSNSNLVIVDNLIKERIVKTENVISLGNFQSSFENRQYMFSCTVTTAYGDVSIEMSL